MLSPSFVVKLGQPFQQGLVTIGRFDGKTPTLCCATTGGKILLHNPHEGEKNLANDGENRLPTVRYLNFNKKITSIAAGSLSSEGSHSSHDILFVGTRSNLLAYDVERNSDLFFRDVSDGANSLVVGRVASLPSPLIIVGGNCSVLGFNREGDESFWTVTGDNVTSLEICDIDSDGNPELIVGSEDFELRIFRHEELLNEISETDKVIFLKTISKGKFAYGLANGTVGVYKGLRNRLWRVKSKYVLSALEVFDMDNDGVVEVISGFTNGSFTVRNETSGEIKFKGSIESSIVAMLVHDYRLSGKLELIVCAESGEVRGYLPAAADSIAAKEASLEELEDQKILSLLQQTKSDLNNELRMLEQGFKNAKSGEPSSGLPLNTSLSLELFADVSAGCVSLLAGVNTEVSIISLIVMDLEGATLTGSEVQAVSPAVPSRTATLHLMPSKPNPCTLKVQVHVALRGNTTQMHVIEAECFLPKFASFGDLSLDKVQSTKPPKSCVSFELNETLASLSNWLKSSFLITQPTLNKFVTKTNMRLGFASVCGPLSTDSSHKAQSTGGQLLFIDAAVNADAIRLQFNCENMDICGEIVQDIARYFKIQDLNTVADFPKEFRRFEAVLANVAESNASRQRLAADMADDSQRVKALVVRAEDSRLLNDMELMRRAYTDLYSTNNQLVGNYNARANNHETLLAALKEVNVMIQRAAGLRVGRAKNTVITECRAAVKTNNMATIVQVIRYGNGVATAIK